MQTRQPEIDVERLISQLCDESRRRTAGTEIRNPYIQTNGNALVASRKRPRLTCGRNGHERNDCWDLHPEKRPSRWHGTAEANLALAVGPRSHIPCQTLSLVQTSKAACAQIPVGLLLECGTRWGCLCEVLGEAVFLQYPVAACVESSVRPSFRSTRWGCLCEVLGEAV